MGASCSFSPDWCKTMKAIPGLSCGSLYSIQKLPTNLPSTMPSEALRTAYGFTDDSQNIAWEATKLSWGDDAEERIDGVYCRKSSDVISAGGDTGTYLTILPNFNNEEPLINPNWIITADRLACKPVDGPSGSEPEPIGPSIPLGPAPQPPTPNQVLPTPTFVPRAGSRGGGGTEIEIADDLSELLKSSKKGSKVLLSLAAGATNDCTGFAPQVLVKRSLDDTKATVAWDCIPNLAAGDCCGLLVLEEVPPMGFGSGTARYVLGYDDDGSFKYGETIPVTIPRI